LSGSGRDGIWLLDDDASMLKALGRLLNSAGFTVEKFSNPSDFLSELERQECRVAVLDVWMPDMNGLEVQTCLRRDSPKTRIIFITGRDDPSSRTGCRSLWLPRKTIRGRSFGATHSRGCGSLRDNRLARLTPAPTFPSSLCRPAPQ